jgi:hypothetical protein
MTAETPQNPYSPPGLDDGALAPFAGRQTAYAALHRRLTKAARPGALLYLGGRYSGKTTLLRRFADFFDESYLGVYLPLRGAPLTSESAWLRALVAAFSGALSDHDYTASRLPQPPDTADLRVWLRDTYLPELFAVVRRHRLVLLLDDAGALLDAMTAKHLPGDSAAYLHSLLETQPGLGMALTLDSQRERDMNGLSPLARGENVFRLSALAAGESAWLLRTPAAACYTLSDESAAALHKATGGQPYLLQRCGYYLFEAWAAQADQRALTLADVKACIPRVYTASEADFQQEWDLLTPNERLVLTAASQLLYTNPLQAIQFAEIEVWLVETDYPLDTTAINAAVRSLEYRDHITLTPGGLTINSGLWQMWLLEHARIPGHSARPASSESATPPNRRVLLALLTAVLLVLLIVALASSVPDSPPETPAAPTVTLATGS